VANYFRAVDGSTGTLGVGDFLYSPTRAFRLGLQDDGNLVLYTLDDFDPAIVQYASFRGEIFDAALEIATYNRPIWATGTNGTNARSWIMQSDGNLVVYQGQGGQGSPVWASNTDGNGGATLVCQDDGNLVIYGWEGGAIWSTNTYSGGR
jgi:hypothetical protein